MIYFKKPHLLKGDYYIDFIDNVMKMINRVKKYYKRVLLIQ